MTEEEATLVCEMLTGNLAYFPAKPAAQGLIVSELKAMCADLEKGIWLATRMCRVFTKWEGLAEMRAVYCSKFTPEDGLELGSAIYPDGIPSEREALPALSAGAQMLALPPGATASADPEAEDMVTEAARARQMPPLPKYYPRKPAEIRVDNELRQLFHLKTTFGDEE